MAERTYARFYFQEFIRDYPDIYKDDAAFAAWMRLFVTAEAMWPAETDLPRSVTRRTLAKLTDRGLVESDGRTYRIKGMDAERTRRQESARVGAAKRWQSDGNANASAPAMPSKDETRRDESRMRVQDDDDGRADLEAFLLVTRRAPTAKQRKLLDDVLRLHDLTGPEWAADIILRNPADPIGAVIAADKEWRGERIAEARKSERPKPTIRRPKSLPQSTQEILAAMKLLDAEREGVA